MVKNKHLKLCIDDKKHFKINNFEIKENINSINYNYFCVPVSNDKQIIIKSDDKSLGDEIYNHLNNFNKYKFRIYNDFYKWDVMGFVSEISVDTNGKYFELFINCDYYTFSEHKNLIRLKKIKKILKK